MPALGLSFLQHADNRYRAVLEQMLERIPQHDGKPLRFLRKEDFIDQAAIFLPASARCDYLAGLAHKDNAGRAIDDAMQVIEEEPAARLYRLRAETVGTNRRSSPNGWRSTSRRSMAGTVAGTVAVDSATVGE